MEYKAKDAVVNKPIPMSIEGLKVQSTGDKGRTKRSKNFSSEEEWKKVLRQPKKRD